MAIAKTQPQGALVLAGGGHSHALLLQRWAMAPSSRPALGAITLVSRSGSSLYSGLVPSLFAGTIGLEACRIDLRRLCNAAQVAFVEAEIIGLDSSKRQLQLRHSDGSPRPPLSCPLLSLDLGASTAAGPAQAMAIKPLEPVLAALGALTPGALVQLIGSGAAAVELSFALRRRGLQVQLLLQSKSRPYWDRFSNGLRAAGVELHVDCEPTSASPALRLLCSGSRGPAWLAATGLPLNQQGRLCTDASLQVLGFPGFFASGDCAVIQQQPRPASGVWAVRAAPILAANLQRLSLGKKLRLWQPQTHALQLLGDGKGRAYGQWGPLRWGASRLSWLWKQKLDQRFMAMLQQPSSVMAGSEEMACSGCAAKLPAQVLNQALNQLGLDQTGPQDAAIVSNSLSNSSSQQWLQSCDGFPALVADPWLNARLTTLHACSDLWASGAQIQSAQLLIQLPRCSIALQSELLSQSLAGVQSVLAQHGAQLLGGHSLQAMAQEANKPLSQQLLLALTVNGFAADPWLKGPLQPGDVLLISRSIGTGVLFAAAQLGKAKSSWISEALEFMQQSQAALLPLLAAHGCQVCTDVTGFGLLGHLTEMLAASPGVQLQLELDAAPALKGALTLLQQGIASSLAPSNKAILEKWPQLINHQSEAILQLWLDPQTCGPLLAAIPAAQAEACLTAMQTNGFPHARQIARVMG